MSKYLLTIVFAMAIGADIFLLFAPASLTYLFLRMSISFFFATFLSITSYMLFYFVIRKSLLALNSKSDVD